jgi:hypothetical protein
MLIKVYCVESRRHGSVDFDPGPVLIGTVQFTATDGMEDQQGEEEKALDHLASHSPQAARHPVLGFVTWEAEFSQYRGRDSRTAGL